MFWCFFSYWLNLVQSDNARKVTFPHTLTPFNPLSSAVHPTESLLYITPPKRYYHLPFLTYQLKCGGVLILKCVVLFDFNHNLVI